jgi:hypothetical protein
VSAGQEAKGPGGVIMIPAVWYADIRGFPDVIGAVFASFLFTAAFNLSLGSRVIRVL